MKNLKEYILGIVTVITLLPILEAITEIICSFLEIIKAYSSIKILKLNKNIEELQSDLEPIATSCMGFEIPSGCEEDEEWEEDKTKKQIGFRI